MKKAAKVVFISRELENEFNTLQETDPIKKGIRKAILDLRSNAFSGTQIPKRLFPKEYVIKYHINNLWKYDLPNGWRLIYTVTADYDVELIAAILEWFGHKDYEKRFKY